MKKKSAAWILIKFTAFSLVLALAVIYAGSAVGERTASANVDVPIKIVIDAGHGGFDGGAVADDGTREKDLNLSLALALERQLKVMGADVIMTRSADVMYAVPSSPHKKLDDLSHRIESANAAGDCIFVSVHMNKFPVPKYSGLQVYYSPNNEESKILSDAIQNAVREALQPDNSRLTKRSGDNIYILYKLTCPAVLVECGFLSNPEELELLKTDEYREKLALVLASALMEYITTK